MAGRLLKCSECADQLPQEQRIDRPCIYWAAWPRKVSSH